MESVVPSRIRSEQSGDWYYDGDTFIIYARNDIPKASQLAILVHELIEAYLCRKHGVTDEAVSAFDDKYEAERKEGKHKEDDEPGDDPNAPYRIEHQAATHVERAACHALDLSWKTHSQSVIETEADHLKTVSLSTRPL